MTIEIPEIIELEKKVSRLTNQFSYFFTKTASTKRTITIKEIAEIEDVSISQLRPHGAERYLLPRFGQSGYPTGKTRWNVEEYLEWSNIDPEERKQAYLESLRNETSCRRRKNK